MGMVAPKYYTADMVRLLPDDGSRYETVHGELLVTPSPRALHQHVIPRITARLLAYLDENPVGGVYEAPADISWAPDILVQPDVLVVAIEQARTLDWARMKQLLLVVEVLSPSTHRYDRFTKRRLYQEHVGTYWIIDPDERLAEVWGPASSAPVVERRLLTWHPEGAAKPFTLSLTDIFPPV